MNHSTLAQQLPDLGTFLSDIEHWDKLSRTEGAAGATPWERPDYYSTSAPVLIQWRQGVELYMALRRLGKRVWMLQYDEGTHALFDRDAVDYTLGHRARAELDTSGKVQ
jgi:hypothetical protein